MREDGHRSEPNHGISQASRAYRPSPGRRQGWASALGLGGVLAAALAGLAMGPSVFGSSAQSERLSRKEPDLWPEAPTELQIEPRSLRFDHMFRAERSVSSPLGS
jgi:hypothetical protein